MQSVCQNLPAFLQTLRWFENQDSNPTAIGLLKKMKKADLISILYISKSVLPVLSILSKVFQKGTISYSRISPASRPLKIPSIGYLRKILLSKSLERKQ